MGEGTTDREENPAGAAPERTLAEAIRCRRLVARAGHEGDTVLARAHLDDPDPSVRATALGALARIATLTAAELTSALRDRDPAVRARACEVAAAWSPTPGNRDVSLLALLDDPDPSVIEVATWACGERPPEPGVVEQLATLATGHDDALCREAAVAALGSLGDEAGLPAVLAATRDKATVRRRAVIALAAFEGPDVDAALEHARADRDWQVRQAAEDLLADD